MNASASHFVFTQTNDARANEVVLYERAADGRLTATATQATGGRGNGKPHLPSQNSIVVSPDARFLLVANAGSNDVRPSASRRAGLRWPTAPTSVARRRASPSTATWSTCSPPVMRQAWPASGSAEDGRLSPLDGQHAGAERARRRPRSGLLQP